MKFFRKFPNATTAEEDQYELDGIDVVYKSKTRYPCTQCGEETYWQSVGTEGSPFCSEECLEQWWKEWMEADNNATFLYGVPA